MFYQCSPTYGKVHHEYKHTEQENIAGITIPIQNMEQVSNKNAMWNHKILQRYRSVNGLQHFYAKGSNFKELLIDNLIDISFGYL